MYELPHCPQCQSEYTYEDRGRIICPMCGYEWDPKAEDTATLSEIKDAHGNVLEDGDSVIVIKDLKVRGSSSSIKQGTRVRNIKLIHEPGDGHNIDCRIEGFGAMKLKSEFVKKA